MNLEKGVHLSLVLLFFFLLSIITYGLTGEEGLETELIDVPSVEQMKGATITPEGAVDITKTPGTNRILTPTDTTIIPIKTNLGEITNAKLEDHISNFGDLVEGKITSFTDDNLISMKSMFDPDLRVEIIMGEGGTATILQYDKYGRLINMMTAEISAGIALQEISGEFGDLFRFEPNNDTDKAQYARAVNEARIEAGTMTFTKDNKTEKVTAPTKAEKPTEITLNKKSGFECATLQQGGSYIYESSEKSLSVTNNNKQDYTVCINKKNKKVLKPKGQRSGYIDLIRNTVDLKTKVTYKHGNKPVYQSFNENNQATINLEEGNIVINNRAPKGKVSEVRIGHHLIIEEKIGNEIKRFHEYTQDPAPFWISSYETSFDNLKLIVREKALIQENPEISNKFIMHEPDSMEMGLCLGEMEEVLNYEKEPSENC
ncbi:MAG: hypothetical protein KKA79_04545 [Nanoarchaeota archaeon]|nr:hypothetical protein [Nanoarchaeota archaeon]